MIAPYVSKKCKETHISVAKVDVDAAPDIAAKFSVQAMPTFVVYKNGSATDTIVGGVKAM